jgi:hypothetical protein
LSQQINLYSRARAGERRIGAIVLLSAAIGVAALTAAVAVYEQVKLRELRAEGDAIGARLKAAQAREAQRAAASGAPKPDTAHEAELVRLIGQVKRRQQVVESLKSGSAGSPAGFSGFMAAFSRQHLSGLWLTGFDIDTGGQELALSGRALNADLVPQYVARLNREALLQGRQFSSVRIEQPPAPPPEPAAKGGKAAAPLRYVDFSLSTVHRSDAAEEKPPRPLTRQRATLEPAQETLEPARAQRAEKAAAAQESDK